MNVSRILLQKVDSTMDETGSQTNGWLFDRRLCLADYREETTRIYTEFR